jgi:RecJ-like exonuclease
MSVFTKAEQIFPIYKVEHDCMVSVQGDLTVAYEVSLPEIFTLSDEDFETLSPVLDQGGQGIA